MPVVVIIPVKSFRWGKRRLTGVLDDAARLRLSRALAGHVASTVESAGLAPLVVTSDPEVAEWSASTGFPILADPGDGLDAAASAGAEWAGHTDSPWLVLHGDLPLLSSRDVDSLVAPLEDGRSVLSPSTDGGTSAIGGHGRFAFAFGVSSFHRHLARLDAVDVVMRPGLALDIDSPIDLEAARGAVGGSWLRDAIG